MHSRPLLIHLLETHLTECLAAAMDYLKLNSSGQDRQNPHPQGAYILAGVSQQRASWGTVDNAIQLGSGPERLRVSALHGAGEETPSVPTIRDCWRQYPSWDVEDGKECQAEGRASVKPGHSNRSEKGSGGRCRLQPGWAMGALGCGGRNYIEGAGKEPDYIGC